ncbi:MAG: folate-binding protein YgfZ [Cocleimonas sp.]|jgi:folate-binding protein YgfZ
MNLDWKVFLQENGAEFVAYSDDNSESGSRAEQLVSFGNPDDEKNISSQDALLSNASERSLIKINGEDAESFLQNQLTNDIRNVTDTSHQASAWCSPKGRIIVNFRIFKRDGDFYLALSGDLIEHVMKKLRMYVMMSKVVIEDVTDKVINFTFAGKQADTLIQEMLSITIPSDAETIQHNSITLVRTVISNSESNSRFDVFAEDIGEAKALWSQCREKSLAVSGKGIRYLDIIAGNPEITAASSEAWIPQMVNYIHINGVDFKKGCYPGQEVVARLNYLGKTKRRMYRLQINSDQLPAIGATIKSDKDAEAGKVLNAVLNADGKIDALAVLKIADATNSLTLVANDATITLLDLPYSISDE